MTESIPAKYSLWRKFLLIFPALSLILLELNHPHSFTKAVYYNLLPQADWWFYLHILQLILFGMIGVAGFLLVEGLKGFDAILSRIGFWIFLVFYSAFDSIAGIGTGILMRYGRTLDPSEQEFMARAVQNLYFDPIAGGSHSWISETASFGWLLGAWAAAFALYRTGISKLAAPLLILSGLSIWYSHAYPYGPIGFAFFLAASLVILYQSSIKAPNLPNAQ